jgi:hypothetical protein
MANRSWPASWQCVFRTRVSRGPGHGVPSALVVLRIFEKWTRGLACLVMVACPPDAKAPFGGDVLWRAWHIWLRLISLIQSQGDAR